MNISNTPAVQSATSAATAPSSDVVNLIVLKKALDAQTAGALSLIQALPQPPLASTGPVGTKVNTFA